MYLVSLNQDHPIQWLFLRNDPLGDGCPFLVEEHVDYSDGTCVSPACADGASLTRFVLGRSKKDPEALQAILPQ